MKRVEDKIISHKKAFVCRHCKPNRSFVNQGCLKAHRKIHVKHPSTNRKLKCYICF